MSKSGVITIAIVAALSLGYYVLIHRPANAAPPNLAHLKKPDPNTVNWRQKGDDYWKKTLTPLQYRVCRHGGTERPFTGHLLQNKQQGTYFCSSCGYKLFDSKTKFKSGTGWPSFYDALNKGAVTLHRDSSHGMVRTEVKCARCNAHLGHLFDDGPPPTNQRYCINSVCLGFTPSRTKTQR